MTKSRQDAIVPRLNRVFSGRCSPSSCGCPGGRLGPDMVRFKSKLEAVTLTEDRMDGIGFVDAVSGPDLRVSFSRSANLLL